MTQKKKKKKKKKQKKIAAVEIWEMKLLDVV